MAKNAKRDEGTSRCTWMVRDVLGEMGAGAHPIVVHLHRFAHPLTHHKLAQK